MATKKPTTPKVAKNKKEVINVKKPTTFYDALFEFQSNDIVIPKKGEGIGRNGKPYKWPVLDDVIRITRPFMQKAGLVYTQVIENNVLTTIVLALHADPSDNRVTSSMDLGKPASAQELGARITYARRYTLLGALGLVGDDDTDAKPEDLLPEMAKTVQVAPAVKESASPREVSKEVEQVDPTASPAYQKAWNAIQSCKSKVSMDAIEVQVKNSVKLTEEEKPKLLEVIKGKVF